MRPRSLPIASDSTFITKKLLYGNTMSGAVAEHDDENSVTEVVTDFKEESSSSVESSRPSSGDFNSERSPSAYGIGRFLISDADQRILSWTRFTFLFCLFVSASALATAVYFNAHHDEEGDFRSKVRRSPPCTTYMDMTDFILTTICSVRFTFIVVRNLVSRHY